MLSAHLIKTQALALGFDAVGVAPARLDGQISQDFFGFLAAGYHGDMDWMETNAGRRADPRALWPEAQSVIIVGHNYGPSANPLEKLAHKQLGAISVYAQNFDYHDVIKKKLRELAVWVSREGACEVKLFVDTAPVMEKPLAQMGGLGWQGKHTCLVSRDFGSWLFLGCLFTTLALAPDTPQTDHCGHCTRCLDICPTNAFTAERRLDARRCIAYLTIEHKGMIPLEFRKAIGNRIYGCDDCLAVCPWNKFAQASKEAAYHPREALVAPRLRELAALDNEGFRRLFAKSPIKRIGRDRFIRNVCIAMGNSQDPGLLDALAPLIRDASPLVSEAARWAAEELR